jgi:hypothetical protein
VFRLIWWGPTAAIVGVGVAAVTGNLDHNHESLFEAIIVGLWAFSTVACIVVYRRKKNEASRLHTD